MLELTRRRLLELGSAATAVSVAGCFGAPGSEGPRAWFPSGTGSLLTAHLDLEVTRQTSNVDPVIPLFLPSNDREDPTEFVPNLPPAEEIDDPLVRFPLTAGGQVIGVSALALVAAGLGHLIDPEASTRELTELVAVDDTVIGIGDIDVARAEESLRSGTGSAFGQIKFTEAGQNGQYTLYEANTDEGSFIALSDDAVVGAEAKDSVRTAIETRRGDHERVVATDATAKWLFDTVGASDLSVGLLGPVDLEDYYWDGGDVNTPIELLAGRENLVSGLSFAPEKEEITATLAVQESGLDDTVRNRFETRMGSAVDASSSVRDDRLVASDTYTDDVLDFEFTERSTPSEEPDVPAGDDVPQEVAAAVSEDTFAFSRNRQKGTVRVDFQEEFDADEVTIRARPSGNESSTTTPDPVTYLTVIVSPDDESVVVIVTVDGSSGIVARENLQ